MMFILPLLLFMASCGILPKNLSNNGGKPTESVEQIVQATFAALTAEAGGQPLLTPVAETPTAGSGRGAISGSLNYPADSLPPMYVTAYEVGTHNYKYVTTNPGQSTFLIDQLEAGTYHVVAYTVGGGGFPAGLAGGYTKAVPCGMATECADHSLIDVSVASRADCGGGEGIRLERAGGDFSASAATSGAHGGAVGNRYTTGADGGRKHCREPDVSGECAACAANRGVPGGVERQLPH